MGLHFACICLLLLNINFVVVEAKWRTTWGTNYPDALAASWAYSERRVRACSIPTGDFVISSMQNKERFMNVKGTRHNLRLSHTPQTWNVVKDRVVYVLKRGDNERKEIVSPDLELIREGRAGRNDVGLFAFYDCKSHHDEYGNITAYTALIMEQISGLYIRSDGEKHVYYGRHKERMWDGKRHRYRWTFTKVEERVNV